MKMYAKRYGAASVSYVAQVAGDGGKDWGYTSRFEGYSDFLFGGDNQNAAILLTPAQCDAFAANCAALGVEAQFRPEHGNWGTLDEVRA